MNLTWNKTVRTDPFTTAARIRANHHLARATRCSRRRLKRRAGVPLNPSSSCSLVVIICLSFDDTLPAGVGQWLSNPKDFRDYIFHKPTVNAETAVNTNLVQLRAVFHLLGRHTGSHIVSQNALVGGTAHPEAWAG